MIQKLPLEGISASELHADLILAEESSDLGALRL